MARLVAHSRATGERTVPHVRSLIIACALLGACAGPNTPPDAVWVLRPPGGGHYDLRWCKPEAGERCTDADSVAGAAVQAAIGIILR
jgi:hypothetical protein